ncbi:TetR/AcrR family transcriptional regulator [Actinomadura sp. WMMB 499]|nr:TetR/AcrR family transcriptional regulator [Actinomadura sp. WMMB 499]
MIVGGRAPRAGGWTGWDGGRVARTRGWGGNPPHDEAEARERILRAAAACIDRFGPKTGLSDVAAELGVTRQTVYAYFPGTHALLIATATRAAGPFLDRLTAHVAGLTDPADILAEAFTHALHTLPDDPHLGILLAGGHTATITGNITSPEALDFARAILHRFPIDWAARGYTPHDLDELAELTLRLMASFLTDPGHPPRAPDQLRAYLRRWLGPVLHAPPDRTGRHT